MVEADEGWTVTGEDWIAARKANTMPWRPPWGLPGTCPKCANDHLFGTQAEYQFIMTIKM